MGGYLKRLLTSGAAYQASSMVSAVLAVITLPLYSRHLSTADYGYGETLLTFVIFAAIILQFGLTEALLRFWFDDDDAERRVRLARTTMSFTAVTTTVAALVGVALAEPLSRLLLGKHDATLMDCGLLGLWAFTNLQAIYALLRVEEDRRTYLVASLANVVLTIALTILLVVVLDTGARGYVLGNYGASAIVLVALWMHRRAHVRPLWPRRIGHLLRFGVPTVPADAVVFLLNVIDRAYLLRAQSPGTAGVYAISVKLSTAVIVAVRGFQAAWPPLAYSVTDDAEAKRLYAFVTTLYVAIAGFIVCALTLCGRWVVRLLAAPDFYKAHEALPWLALGWALYGLYLLFISIAGRAKVMTRNFPAAAAGVVVNVVVLVVLVGPLDIAGAGIALAAAYLVMLAVIHQLTKRLFTVPFEWGRIALAVGVFAGVAVAGELLLPTAGFVGLVTRAAAAAAAPVVLLAAGFLHDDEVASLKALATRRRDAA